MQDLLSERGEIDQQLSETLQHIAENNGQIQDLNNNIEQDETSVLSLEGNAENEEAEIKARAAVYGQVFSTAFTTAATTGLLANSPLKAFGATIGTTLVAMIPQVVGIFSEMGIQSGLAFIKSAGPVALVITGVVAAATAGVVAIRNKLKEIEDNKIENRITAAKSV